VAWVGLTEDQAKAQGIKVKKGLFPWNASGRVIANGRDEGVTKLLFDDSPEAHGHGKIIGPKTALDLVVYATNRVAAYAYKTGAKGYFCSKK
jgi:pyruvate/2-oxoglutarate dehydrogenase complex dihydrolipoamide dehydrogenase (E3) component